MKKPIFIDFNTNETKDYYFDEITFEGYNSVCGFNDTAYCTISDSLGYKNHLEISELRDQDKFVRYDLIQMELLVRDYMNEYKTILKIERDAKTDIISYIDKDKTEIIKEL